MKKIINKKKGKKNSGRILKGALVGAALGVAAGMLLASEAGRNIGKDIKKYSGAFYRSLAPQIKKMRRLGEAEYHALVAKGVQKFAVAKKLSIAEERALETHAKRSWKHIQKHLR